MAFAIMRMAKIKDKRGVYMTLEHNTRGRMPSNADPEKSEKNWSSGGDTIDAMQKLGMMIHDIPRRKNGVLAVEVVMTSSPEFSGNWTAYLNACDKWAKELFGKDNVLHVAHHKDEKTPHTHIVFVPRKDNRLNAKFFIGGHRNRMVELQTDFYNKVGKQFGLERGKPREETKAKHSHHTLSGRAAELDELEKRVIKKLEAAEKYHSEQVELAKKLIRETEEKAAKVEAEKKALKNNWLGDVFYDLTPEENFEVVKVAKEKANELRAAAVKRKKQQGIKPQQKR